jgi:hypothetical protein
MKVRQSLSGEQKTRDRLIMDNILSIMKFCSFALVISFVNGGRYLFFKKKLKLIYEKRKEEIDKAIGCNKIKFSAFLTEPLETGDDVLDLLLFKAHSSAKWFVGFIFFYVICVAFLSMISLLQKIRS